MRELLVSGREAGRVVQERGLWRLRGALIACGVCLVAWRLDVRWRFDFRARLALPLAGQSSEAPGRPFARWSLNVHRPGLETAPSDGACEGLGSRSETPWFVSLPAVAGTRQSVGAVPLR